MGFDPGNHEVDAVPEGMCADCWSTGAKYRPDWDRSLCADCYREVRWWADVAREQRKAQ